jgi:threonine/homoserine/homoserine lactone efflux protein
LVSEGAICSGVRASGSPYPVVIRAQNLIKVIQGHHPYLLYLGIKAIRSTSPIDLKADKKLMSNKKMLLTGMATSVMNPKGILLFFSYFPQFVAPEAGNVTRQLFVIGTLFTVMCGLVYGTYGFFSGAIGERLSAEPRIAKVMKWFTGSVLIGLGVRLALPDKK